MKVETITFEYEHCGECTNADYRGDGKKYKCLLKKRLIPDLWGEIPDWCPLPDKEE